MTGDVIVSQLGARRHYAIPRLLASAGRLARFCTDIYATPSLRKLIGSLPRPVAGPALRRLADRVPHDIAPERCTMFPLFALHSAQIRLRIRNDSEVTCHALWAGQRFSRLVARQGFAGAAGLYAFSGDALEQLEAARRAGLWTALDQMNGPRALLDRWVAEVHARFPDWQEASAADVHASAFAARERAEWAVADVIVCPSDFVRRGIEQCGGPVKKCVVVPYGIDASFAVAERSRAPGPLRVLTVGQIGLRKGSPFVHAAALRLKGRAAFRMVGPCAVSEAAMRRLANSVEVTGPIPRSEMREQFAWADVFLLPSVCEGSAMAVYEALAAGLPVIVTDHTGSVARDGEDGFIVPLGDVGTIVARIETLASDADLRRHMARSARQRAQEFRFDGYGDRLLAALPPAGASDVGHVSRRRPTRMWPGPKPFASPAHGAGTPAP